MIAARNEPVRQRTAKLNQLLDLYGANALDAAIVQALESGAPAVGSVAYLLDKEHRRSGRVLRKPSRCPNTSATRMCWSSRTT